MIGYPDVASAADAVPKIVEHAPIALKGFDDRLVTGHGRLAVDGGPGRTGPVPGLQGLQDLSHRPD